MKPGDQYHIEGVYYNANGFATAIVAVVTHKVNWAAYIGATLDDLLEQETVLCVTRKGCKLPEAHARHFFPELAGWPYRP